MTRRRVGRRTAKSATPPAGEPTPGPASEAPTEPGAAAGAEATELTLFQTTPASDTPAELVAAEEVGATAPTVAEAVVAQAVVAEAVVAEDVGATAPTVAARSSIRDVVAGWRDLLELSRPRSWAVTALPFLVAGYDAQRGLSVALVLGTVYFLGPYNLLIHGLEPGPTQDASRTVRLAIALTNLPLLAVLVLLSGPTAGFAMLVAVAAALAYSVPPIRARGRPVLDVVGGAALVVLPALCGALAAGLALTSLPWLALAALAAWAVAAYAVRAIVHLGADRAAGVTSIATALGARPTALLVLAGFALAILVVGGLGPLGGLASLGLGLYLLLPPMVLLAPRHAPAALDAAGRRAWSGFLGLRFLVGPWIALLLLRHWGVLTEVDGTDLLLGLSAGAAALVGWNIIATRLATRRRRIRPDAERPVPSLTIVVTSHDDGDRLLACVEALLEQTYADAWILVVDEGSTDGSPELAAGMLGGAGQVLGIEPPPDGRTALDLARRTGAESSEDELVMFVDVDTILLPVATRILVEQMQTGRWDLLSGVTRFEMPTAGERATVPGFALLRLGFRPIWWSALTAGRPARMAFADRSLMLMRRDAYLAAPVDESGLAGSFVRAGHRVGTVHVADLAATRRDPGAGAAVAAWRRAFLPTVGGSLAGAILAIAAQVLAFVVPLILPVVALASGVDARAAVASFIPLFLLGSSRFALVLTQRQPLSTVLWHPVTILVALVGQFAALVDHVTGRAPAARRWDRAMPAAVTSDHPS
jgi:4-hydroxybenzoate polyprenyltransferase